MNSIDGLKFDDKGLIPAIVQDFKTGQVLMLAYMNRESLDITLKEKTTCFFSRSRQELWRKGSTSGNRQHVVSITADCDKDTLVVKVIKDGPACHTGEESCFFNPLYNDDSASKFSMQELYELIAERKRNPKEGSYTNYLFDKGMEKILKKIGEESTEVVISAMKHSNEETIFEISDLSYHILVLMVENGISVEDIYTELAARHVIDHKVKQETLK